ncbi:metallophosphoesterase [Pseudonocardia sp. KRD291]|uniref:metallophosphoesterase family protein n=1 Tax=Pseudonocardia sp. KRD291 TaxID=2792007 RepID=UPI001C49E1A5|nr:metallophosphoesterase [Pseudonocardia sp. KRD291]MBW0106338.1 metallophosphoesterase [Pseudonocardia sp. KRD291]
MARVLLISDTHVPTRAADLPDVLWSAVDAADVVVHAGDWMDESLLDRLEDRSALLVACWGNNDGPELRARLPETAHAEIGGVRVAVTHETGAAQGRERRCARDHPDVDLLVFGHSHIPWDSTAELPDGRTLRLLNPGSPTDRRRRPTHTWMTLELDGGRIGPVTLHHREQTPGA